MPVPRPHLQLIGAVLAAVASAGLFRIAAHAGDRPARAVAHCGSGLTPGYAVPALIGSAALMAVAAFLAVPAGFRKLTPGENPAWRALAVTVALLCLAALAAIVLAGLSGAVTDSHLHPMLCRSA